MQPKIWELCFIQWTFWGLKPRRQPLSWLCEIALKRWWRSQDREEILQQKPGSQSSKRWLLVKEKQIPGVNEASAFLCMSGLIEIIPLTCTWATWGQDPCVLHPESPQGAQSRMALVITDAPDVGLVLSLCPWSAWPSNLFSAKLFVTVCADPSELSA